MEPFLFFRTLTREQALALTAVASEKSDAAKINRAFFEGDAWQDGEGWIGPIPAANDKSFTDVQTEIRRAFNSKDIVGEVVRNQRDGVLGPEPAWSLVRSQPVSEDLPLTDAQAAFIDELNTEATLWWDARGLTQILRAAHDAAALGERVTLRLYIPRGRLTRRADGGTEVPGGSVRAQLSRLWVELCIGADASAIEDAETRFRGALYSQTRDKGYYIEIVWAEEQDEKPALTFLRVMERDGEEERDLVYEMDFAGHLPLCELSMPALISPSVISNQKSINLQKTLQNRNSVTGGFLERLITDAMPPGKYVDDPERPGKEIYQVAPFQMGAGRTTFLLAAEYGEGANRRAGSPAVHYRDPVSVETFIEAKRDAYQDALEECGQTHTLIAGDATASGESRKQARQTFENRLNGVKAAFDPLGRWLLETALVMALFFAGRRGEWDGYRVDFACQVDTGPRSADERREDHEAVKAGVLSEETAMVRDGIEDPGAEINRIEGEAERSLGLAEKRARVVQTLAAAGAGIGAAARAAGFDNDAAAELEGVGEDKEERP